jgi:hypothetical protein
VPELRVENHDTHWKFERFVPTKKQTNELKRIEAASAAMIAR